MFDIGIANNEVVKLTKSQVNELSIAISQINAGEYLTHAQAKKQSEE